MPEWAAAFPRSGICLAQGVERGRSGGTGAGVRVQVDQRGRRTVALYTGRASREGGEPPCPSAARLATVVPSVWSAPGQSQRQQHRSSLPLQGSPRTEEDQAGLARPELRDRSGRLDPASLDTGHPSVTRAATPRGVAIPCPSAARHGLVESTWTFLFIASPTSRIALSV